MTPANYIKIDPSLSVWGAPRIDITLEFDESDVTHRALRDAHFSGEPVQFKDESVEFTGFVTQMDAYQEHRRSIYRFLITT